MSVYSSILNRAGVLNVHIYSERQVTVMCEVKRESVESCSFQNKMNGMYEGFLKTCKITRT